jgi:Na+/H+-dicarboxylate symporter/ABC-type amino acid transport substrate-binding protein
MKSVGGIFRAFFGMSLTLQMILATLLGIFFGLFLGDFCTVFGPWGNAYILVLKITAIPYLICAVIHGIGRLATGVAKDIVEKGILFIGMAWAVNIAMIYLTLFLFPKSHGLPYASFSSIPPASLNFAQFLIPDNIFYALSNNIVPAIVIFGLLLGIALMHIKEKQAVMSLLETLVDALTRITGWIARITPIGTFLIIAYQIGTIQLDTVKQVSTYLILFIASTLLITFWIFPRLLSMLTTIPSSRWVKDLTPILVLAYTTNVVIVTLPFIIELIKKEVEAIHNKDGRIRDQIQGIVTIVFNLPLGSLFLTLYVFFVALFYHIPFSIGSHAQLFLTTFLTSLGSIGLGSSINSLNFLLDTLGLPLDAIDLYLTTLPFTVGFQSMVSVMEIATLTLFIILACHKGLSFRWHKIARSVCFIALPVLSMALILKLFNPFPPVTNTAKSICDLNLDPPTHVHIVSKADPLPASRRGDAFDRILKSQVLRVGYNAETMPFCFENSENHMVGYDIAFAYELAKDLNCRLEFIPFNFDAIAAGLNQGLFDIAMSGVSMTERRIEKTYFSDPYLTSRIVFVMRKKFRKELMSVESILQHPSAKVAVLRGSSYESLAKTLFPPSKIVLLESYEDFAHHYPNTVLMRGEPQAISWSLRYPSFIVVLPDPPLTQESLAYPVAEGEDRLLYFLNSWLSLKKNEGFTQKMYDLWVLGKTETALSQEPRWSIIRNVLHWVD